MKHIEKLKRGNNQIRCIKSLDNGNTINREIY